MELGERRRKILAAVVDDYVKTAEPVGSETLMHRYNFGVKPATIRNELAAMSEMGYLRQPHTSAGRVPSDLGYRYYVDELMPTPALDPGEYRRVKHSYDPCEGEVEDILQQTCRILSSLTSYTSLVTPPQMDTISIKHVALSAVDRSKILVVTVLNTGHVDHRVVDCGVNQMPDDLAAVGNFINVRFREVGLSSFSASANEEILAEMLNLDWLYRRITAVLKQALVSAIDDDIYMDGTANMLKQPEFAHGGRIASIMGILERRRALFQLLSEDATVIIGAENQFDEMRECSFVTSRYSIGGEVRGSIGLIGPTRMDYRRAVAAVKFMASNLSELLTSLSVG